MLCTESLKIHLLSCLVGYRSFIPKSTYHFLLWQVKTTDTKLIDPVNL